MRIHALIWSFVTALFCHPLLAAFEVGHRSLDKGENGAPVTIEIFAAQSTDPLPVIYFNHGFMLKNSYYSQLLSNIASQGFIVVAPQLYKGGGLPIGKPTKVEEAARAKAVLDWISGQLETAIDQPADTDNLGLLGHSRGGTVAYILMMENPLPKSVATIDPVDGDRDGSPRIGGQDFAFKAPNLIIGTGLGGISGGIFSPACAPVADNHEMFFQYSPQPSWHMVTKDYGHMDMLNPNLNCGLVCSSCKEASREFAKEKMIEQLSQSLGAFFQGTLNEDTTSLNRVLEGVEGVRLTTQQK